MSVHIVLTNLNVAKLNSLRCSSCDRKQMVIIMQR